MMTLELARGRWWTRRAGAGGRLLALDLETTGLDAARAEILAIGTVPVVAGAVRVGQATSTLVRPHARSAAAGIVAHHLRPCEVADAPPLRAVLPGLLARIADADALLVHHAGLDVRVLRRACAALDWPWPGPAVVDTVELLDRFRRRQRALGEAPVPLDLAGARAALGLPPHTAHDATADAIATAELYLALTTRLRAG
jgi:DNA polymerase-3 subunit epsilon